MQQRAEYAHAPGADVDPCAAQPLAVRGPQVDREEAPARAAAGGGGPSPDGADPGTVEPNGQTPFVMCRE